MALHLLPKRHFVDAFERSEGRCSFTSPKCKHNAATGSTDPPCHDSSPQEESFGSAMSRMRNLQLIVSPQSTTLWVWLLPSLPITKSSGASASVDEQKEGVSFVDKDYDSRALTVPPRSNYLFDRSIENILHDLLLEIHQEEKVSRMQTAVVEVEQRAERLGKKQENEEDDHADDEPVETDSALFKSGQVQLKGNPMKTIKHIRCPNCRLRRLLYPRVGYNSRAVPDSQRTILQD